MGVIFTAKASSAGAHAASSAAAYDFSHPRSRSTANGVTVAVRRYGIAPIGLGTNVAARKYSTQSSNFDHHSCGDLVTAEEGIAGFRGARGVVLAHNNVLNFEFSKYRQLKARGGSATADR
jgi:hypothetical protein